MTLDELIKKLTDIKNNDWPSDTEVIIHHTKYLTCGLVKILTLGPKTVVLYPKYELLMPATYDEKILNVEINDRMNYDKQLFDTKSTKEAYKLGFKTGADYGSKMFSVTNKKIKKKK